MLCWKWIHIKKKKIHNYLYVSQSSYQYETSLPWVARDIPSKNSSVVRKSRSRHERLHSNSIDRSCCPQIWLDRLTVAICPWASRTDPDRILEIRADEDLLWKPNGWPTESEIPHAWLQSSWMLLSIHWKRLKCSINRKWLRYII